MNDLRCGFLLCGQECGKFPKNPSSSEKTAEDTRLSKIATEKIRKWYDEMIVLLQEGLIEALEEAGPTIQALPCNEPGEIPINAMSFDLYPWHEYIAISFRSHDQAYTEEEFDIAAWTYFELVRTLDCKSPKFKKASKHVCNAYQKGKFRLEGQASAHLIFLAAATALLSTPVIAKLREIGFVETTELPKEPNFESDWGLLLIVKDWDATFSFNYCELVQANHIAALLLGGEKFY